MTTFDKSLEKDLVKELERVVIFTLDTLVKMAAENGGQLTISELVEFRAITEEEFKAVVD